MQRELVERAMAGDRDAFSELQRGSIDRLYAIARLILRDSDRAQDATQEAYIAAWRSTRLARPARRGRCGLRAKLPAALIAYGIVPLEGRRRNPERRAMAARPKLPRSEALGSGTAITSSARERLIGCPCFSVW